MASNKEEDMDEFVIWYIFENVNALREHYTKVAEGFPQTKNVSAQPEAPLIKGRFIIKNPQINPWYDGASRCKGEKTR